MHELESKPRAKGRAALNGPAPPRPSSREDDQRGRMSSRPDTHRVQESGVSPSQIEAIARSHLRRYRKSFDRLVDWTDSAAIPIDRLHHSRFGDFQKDPLEVLALLYERFGMEWTPEAEAAMRAALDENPVGRLGAHVYARDGLGPGIEELRRDFARYQQRFGVPSDD